MLRFTHKELSLQILNKIAKINRLTNSIQIIILGTDIQADTKDKINCRL